MRKSRGVSSKRVLDSIHFEEDYPLQGTTLDVSLQQVMSYSSKKRTRYIHSLLAAFHKAIKQDHMWVKTHVPFKREMRDLRKLLHTPADQYLRVDDKTLKRNILSRGGPGSTHTYWSRTNMWKMKTKGGDLVEEIADRGSSLVTSLKRFFNPAVTSMELLRNYRDSAVINVLAYFKFDKGVGTAFPPFHAKYFADKYLPRDGDGIVVDPCAGWGGRMLGTLCVNRPGHVRYYGVDPERRNQVAYKGLMRRLNHYLKRELSGKRTGRVFISPFEDWIQSKFALKLRRQVDLVITSPPYFSAEHYNPTNKKQSANRYQTYATWREQFYRPLMKGAMELLKPGGVFVLNIADVAEARHLEKDARVLAREVGFVNGGFYKMALSMLPHMRHQTKIRHKTWVNGKLFKHEPVFVFQRPLT